MEWSRWHGFCKDWFCELTNNQPLKHMLNWTLIFLVIALLAGALGFGGIAGTAMEIARVIFIIFLVLFIASFITRKA